MGCWLIALSLLSCNALQPSANLENFKQYRLASTTGNNTLHVTWFGTSTLLFDDGKDQLMVDGFFSRPSAFKAGFGKLRVDKQLVQAYLKKHDISRLRGIFVCHSHYDHSMDAPYVAELTAAKVHGSASTGVICKGYGLPDSLFRIFSCFDTLAIGKFNVVVLPSIHTPPFSILGKSNATDVKNPTVSKPFTYPSKEQAYIEGGTFDFYIVHQDYKMMIKASTNFIPDIQNNYPVDTYFLGMAMLGKMSTHFKNRYWEETVLATQAKRIIPIHYDNFFRPLSKPLKAISHVADDVNDGFDFLIEKCKEHKKEFNLIEPSKAYALY